MLSGIGPAEHLQAVGVNVVTDVPFHPPWLKGPAAGYTIAFTTLHPCSRGSVRLADADPASAPLIDPNYFGDDRDMEAMLTALRVARDIGGSPAFDDWRADEVLPGPDVRDPAELRNYLRHGTDPYNHPVGTCRIGTDPAAVVDPQLRVRGVDRLRVADASVMPAIPGANTYAAVLAIAERASTLIGK
jgi:choline dehydrogenase